MRASRVATILSGCIGLATSTEAAFAHTGLEHVASFSSGFLHPLSGLDHVLAMVAVGQWAGLDGGRAVWAWPIAFVGVMLIGGALGMAHVGLPAVEAGILASIVILGLLVLCRRAPAFRRRRRHRRPLALLHGYCAWCGAAGSRIRSHLCDRFVLATGLLHAAGIAVALLSEREGADCLRAAPAHWSRSRRRSGVR